MKKTIQQTDEGFSELQLRRRSQALLAILSRDKELTLEQLVTLAYNAGFGDSQNETRISFRLD